MFKMFALRLTVGIAVLNVVSGAPLRVAESLIGVGDETERFRVPGFLVIWMKTLGLDAVDAMDGLLIGVGADL